MRKLIVTEFVSLDGVMEAPGGEPGYRHSGWVGGVLLLSYAVPATGRGQTQEASWRR